MGQYLESIGSYLPARPLQSVWQFCQQIDTLYLAVAGGLLLFTLLVIIAIKKWEAKESNNSKAKSQEKQKPQGKKNIRYEEADTSRPTKWKKPDTKPSTQKVEEKPKSSWLGGLTEKIAPAKKEKSPTPQAKEQKKGWFSFSKDERSNDKAPKQSAP